MPQYTYQAINRSGQTINGQINTKSTKQAIAQLAENGIFVHEIKLADSANPESKKSYIGPVSRLKLSERERAEFIRQLATALQAKFPLLTALHVVGQQNPSKVIKKLVTEISDIITAGQSFSYAIARFPKVFDKMHISMIAVGESAGDLEHATEHLATLIERDQETRSNILTASLYPAFVLCLGLISVAVVVTWIMPQILGTLAGDTSVLPWATRAIISVSDFLRHFGWLAVVAVLLFGLVLRRWARTKTGRFVFDGLKLRIPILGTVLQKWAVARFARTLGTLCHGGVDILEALAITRNSLGNEVLAREVDQLATQVRAGKTLARPLRQSGRFPALLVQIVAIGEETGQLPDLLLKAADSFDRDTSVAIKRFMALFPAILIFILALIVGFIVMGTLLPIVQIETTMPGI